MVKVRVKRGYLYLDTIVDRVHHWEALHVRLTDDKAMNKQIMQAAELMRSTRELQIAKEGWGIVDRDRGKTKLIEYLQEIGGHKTKKHRVHRVIPYIEKYGQNPSLASINGKWIEDFQHWLVGESGLGIASAADYMSAVRFALRRASQQGIIPRNPAEGVMLPHVPEVKKVFLSIEEIRKMDAAPIGGKLGKDAKRAFLFACFTGIRVSDLRTLTWEDIEENPPQIVKRQYKTERTVFIPLNADALRYAGERCEGLVFPVLGSTRTETNRYLNQWAANAGVNKHIGWHTARHTFAVMALESGADVYTVSRLLGHTSVKTTEVYARATDKMRKEAVAALPRV